MYDVIFLLMALAFIGGCVYLLSGIVLLIVFDDLMGKPVQNWIGDSDTRGLLCMVIWPYVLLHAALCKLWQQRGAIWLGIKTWWRSLNLSKPWTF